MHHRDQLLEIPWETARGEAKLFFMRDISEKIEFYPALRDTGLAQHGESIGS